MAAFSIFSPYYKDRIFKSLNTKIYSCYKAVLGVFSIISYGFTVHLLGIFKRLEYSWMKLKSWLILVTQQLWKVFSSVSIRIDSALTNDTKGLFLRVSFLSFNSKVAFYFEIIQMFGMLLLSPGCPFRRWTCFWTKSSRLCEDSFFQVLRTNDNLHIYNAHCTHLVIFCSCMSLNQPFGNTTQSCVEETVSSEYTLL